MFPQLPLAQQVQVIECCFAKTNVGFRHSHGRLFAAFEFAGFEIVNHLRYNARITHH